MLSHYERQWNGEAGMTSCNSLYCSRAGQAPNWRPRCLIRTVYVVGGGFLFFSFLFFCAIICCGSSIRNRRLKKLNKLIKKAVICFFCSSWTYKDRFMSFWVWWTAAFSVFFMLHRNVNDSLLLFIWLLRQGGQSSSMRHTFDSQSRQDGHLASNFS